MPDSENRTGENIIGQIGKDAILYCTTTEDQREQYNVLMDIVRNGKPKEQIMAIKTLWEFTVAKPKQTTDINLTQKGDEYRDTLKELKKLINEQSTEADKSDISES